MNTSLRVVLPVCLSLFLLVGLSAFTLPADAGVSSGDPGMAAEEGILVAEIPSRRRRS